MNDLHSEKDRLTISFQIHGDIVGLLKRPLEDDQPFQHTLRRRASIKDVIESLGVLHTEVGRLRANGTDVDFNYIVQDNDLFEVFPPTPPIDVFTPTILRPNPLPAIRFVADVNVGKLASLLRMAGFDTAHHNNLHDAEIAEIAHNEKRIVLTKDTHLLKRKIVEYGHLIREVIPINQLREVIHLFGLNGKIKPFSRCLKCNGFLEPVAKENILHRLLPLTKKYYNTFHRCPQCDRIYWPGSHKEKMRKYLNGIDHTEPIVSG